MNLPNGQSFSVKLIPFKPILTRNVIVRDLTNVSWHYNSMFLLSPFVDSSRQKGILAVQFAGSIALRVVCYIVAVYFMYTHAAQHAIACDLFLPELERFPLAVSALAFPSAPEGTVSVAIWALICNIAVKEALNAFIA